MFLKNYNQFPSWCLEAILYLFGLGSLHTNSSILLYDKSTPSFLNPSSSSSKFRSSSYERRGADELLEVLNIVLLDFFDLLLSFCFAVRPLKPVVVSLCVSDTEVGELRSFP